MDAAIRFINAVNDAIINPLLALLFALALLLFLFGGFRFVAGAGNETARQEGRSHMLWGLVGMVIMLSVYALLRIGLNTFGVDIHSPEEGLPGGHPLRGNVEFRAN